MSISKVAIILHKTDLTGGPGHTLLNSIEHFDNSKFQYYFLVTERGEIADRLTEKGFTVKYIPYGEIDKKNPIPFLICLFKTIFWLKVQKIKLVHFQFDFYRDPVFQAARILGLKTIMHIRGYSQDPKKGWFDKADYFIFNSNLTKSNKRFESIPENRKVVIHNGISQKYFKIGDLIQKKDGEPFIIANVSRVHPSKKIEDFLKIADQLIKYEKAEFWIVGNIQDYKYFQLLQELVIELGIEKFVKFLGHQQPISELYAKFDLMIHTARNEPFGMIFLEAGLAKVPVIASRPSGVEDIAKDQEDLLFFEHGNITQAADLAKKLLSSEEIRNKLTSSFYHKVTTKHHAKDYCKKIENCYTSLISMSELTKENRLNILYLTMNPNRQSTTIPTEGWFLRYSKYNVYPVLVCEYDGAFPEWCKKSKIPTYKVSLMHPCKKKLYSSFISLVKISLIILRHRIQIIHANEQNVLPVAGTLSKLWNLPLFVSIHFTLDRDFCKWIFKKLNNLKRIIFTSESSKELSKDAIYNLVDENQCIVIKNGIDLKLNQKSEEKRILFQEKLNIDKQLILGVAAYLRPRKQIEHLIEAVARIRTNEIVIVIAGSHLNEDREYANYLKDLSKKLLGDRVKFLGHLDDLSEFLSGIDIYINTSQEEACSISILQALSFSCPVIGYPSKGTVSEQVMPGGGVIVDQDNIDELSNIIEYYLNNRDLLSALSRGARERVIKDYDIESQTELLVSEYNQVL